MSANVKAHAIRQLHERISGTVHHVGDEACALHREHSPRALTTVEWHEFPLELQRILFAGEVRVADNFVLMCPTGEQNVRLALYDLFMKRGWTARYTIDERRHALAAYDCWIKAGGDEDATGS